MPFIIVACLCFTRCSYFSSYENESVTDTSSATQTSTETLSEYIVSNSEFKSPAESDVSITETTQSITAESTALKTDDIIPVPAAGYMREGKHYSEVLETFENAGFTNVTLHGFQQMAEPSIIADQVAVKRKTLYK